MNCICIYLYLYLEKCVQDAQSGLRDFGDKIQRYGVMLNIPEYKLPECFSLSIFLKSKNGKKSAANV